MANNRSMSLSFPLPGHQLSQCGVFASSVQSASVMDVDAGMASAMLATSHHNRQIRNWYVEWLGAAMVRGDWQVTSQGIGFSCAGHMRDGHHRLLAVMSRRVTIRTLVVLGLSDDAYGVTDTGMTRTTADLMEIPRSSATALRLATEIALGASRPTVAQMRPVWECGLGRVVGDLIAYSPTRRRYSASAPIVLAAAITVMSGGDPEYVRTQFRALCLLDFDAMSQASKSLVRQVQSGKASVFDKRDALSRGLRVFDIHRANISKVQLKDGCAAESVAAVKACLCAAMATTAGKP